MAEVVKVVDPDSGAGFDYDSLFDWEAGEQTDLDAANNIAVAKCRCTGGTADTTAVTIDGWTTSATDYIKIWTDPSESYRHAGKYPTGNKYRLETASGTSLLIDEAYTKLYGLPIKNAVALQGCLTVGSSSTVTNFVGGYLFLWQAGTSASWCVSLSAYYTVNAIFFNCIGLNASSYNHTNTICFGWIGSSTTSLTVTFYNCTAYGGYNGFAVNSSNTNKTMVCKNCLGAGSAGNEFSNPNSWGSSDYNASDDTTSPGGAHDHTEHTFSFVDSGNGDFHLQSSDAGAKDLGVSDPGSGLFSDDIDGQTRSGSWDIGADEYVAAGTTRELIAAIAGASSTPGIGATSLRALLSAIAGASSTPGISATTLRAILSAIAGSSLTPDISASISRAILANLQTASLTPEVAATLSRALAAAIAGASSTPGIEATTVRAILAQIPGESLTPDLSMTIIRALASSIAGESFTPDITATIQGIISLLANIAGTSVTPGISATTSRALLANLSAGSVSPDILASMARSLLASISGSSQTPEITIQTLLLLAANIAGVSLTPDISIEIARTLSALCSGQSVTPDIQATVARMLLADIHGTSITPDDLILILAALGLIIDPTIEQITPSRTFASISVKRTIHNK